METIFLVVVVFLIVLAVFDLVVGVSNDAVNFLNSAIGAKVARYGTIVAVAAVGVFAGASMSNGMMDVARHGILTPVHFSFFDVMCVFLAVMVTDVVLLDVFNSLGLPTSTTVSMVFELLGGAFGLAIIKIAHGATDANGVLLTMGDLINTEKAISVILGIFLSVGVAFLFGAFVQWIARIVFSFTYRVNGKTTAYNGEMGGLTASSLKIGVFGGIAVTSIIWFLLINGLKNSTLMTPDVKEWISQNTWMLLGGGLTVFSVIMTLLSALKVPVLKFVVLLGTFALAMAFAGNDLVNFVGVPLAGLDAFRDYTTNGAGDPSGFMMGSLMESAKTPGALLIFAGVIMVLSLVFSKKAHNVVKTSVDLARQDSGDEMFGTSGLARTLVRTTRTVAANIAKVIPAPVARWVDSRFNADEAKLANGAAFDQIRAAVNLVLAGLLVAFGTSHKLPLSTTYVTFMVAMGTSLADRAWGRESAVFRITGVVSVIGGWFITAGVAFIFCYLVTNAMYFGSFVAMGLAIVLAIYLLIRSHLKYKRKQSHEVSDEVFHKMLRAEDPKKRWEYLRQHVIENDAAVLQFVASEYETDVKAFFHEEYRTLKRSAADIEEQRRELKRQRRREIIGMRRIDPMLAVERNTWYFLSNNSMAQLLYCLKRINEPVREHVGNNFVPVQSAYADRFLIIAEEVQVMVDRTRQMLVSEEFEEAELIRTDAQNLQTIISNFRSEVINDMHQKSINIESMTVLLNMVQESQELLSALRHMVRAISKFQ